MGALFSAADYAAQLRALMPRGRAWSTDPDSVQAQVLGALAQTFETADADAQGLLVDAFPATTEQLLPEWEASLGLPDPCAGPSPTVPQRQGQVVARLIGGGGHTIAFYEAFASALGFTATIQTYAPFCVGRNACGQPLAGAAWAFALGVAITANPGGLPTSVLLCELNRIRLAHTVFFLVT